MPKNDAPAAPTPTPSQADHDRATPVLGQTCVVRVADGLLLKNTETGAHFAPGEPTSQTVTTTTLRRLADGDLVLVA
jgi:hypothetical protein